MKRKNIFLSVFAILTISLSSCFHSEEKKDTNPLVTLKSLDINDAKSLLIASSNNNSTIKKPQFNKVSPRNTEVYDVSETKLYKVNENGLVTEVTYKDNTGNILSVETFAPLYIRKLNNDFTWIIFGYEYCIARQGGLVNCDKEEDYLVRNSDGAVFKAPWDKLFRPTLVNNSIINGSTSLYYHKKVSNINNYYQYQKNENDSRVATRWSVIYKIDNTNPENPFATQISLDSDHSHSNCSSRSNNSGILRDCSLALNLPDGIKHITDENSAYYDYNLTPFVVDANNSIFYRTPIEGGSKTRIITSSGNYSLLKDFIPVIVGPDGHVYGYEDKEFDVNSRSVDLYKLEVNELAEVEVEKYYSSDYLFYFAPLRHTDYNSQTTKADTGGYSRLNNRVFYFTNRTEKMSLVELFNPEMEPKEIFLDIEGCETKLLSNSYLYCTYTTEENTITLYRIDPASNYSIDTIDISVFDKQIELRSVSHITTNDVVFFKALRLTDGVTIQGTLDINNNVQIIDNTVGSVLSGKEIITMERIL